MLSILTGLPVNRTKDLKLFSDFAKTEGIKVICGTSTMKAYCSALNLKPEIFFSETDGLPCANYKIAGIFLASEGIITLNCCYKILAGKQSKNQTAEILSGLLKNENRISFTMGTAKNPDAVFYRTKNLLPREEIIDKIIDILPQDKKIKLIKI